jgi:hypothetical protein
MFVYCESCVLSGRGLYNRLITYLEESYQLWFVVVFPGPLEAVASKEKELNELKYFLVHKKELKQFHRLITVRVSFKLLAII